MNDHSERSYQIDYEDVIKSAGTGVEEPLAEWKKMEDEKKKNSQENLQVVAEKELDEAEVKRLLIEMKDTFNIFFKSIQSGSASYLKSVDDNSLMGEVLDRYAKGLADEQFLEHEEVASPLSAKQVIRHLTDPNSRKVFLAYYSSTDSTPWSITLKDIQLRQGHRLTDFPSKFDHQAVMHWLEAHEEKQVESAVAA